MTADNNPDNLSSTQLDPEETPVAGETEEPSVQAGPSQEDLAALQSELDQWRDRFLRKAAELENFRKRMERERAEAAILTKISILLEFLPVMDDCERALESFREESDSPEKLLQTYREGVELLYRQLSSILNRAGVVSLEAKGKEFDPNLHEAITHMETREHADNIVMEELRRGYLFRDRLLRPAQVVVARNPESKEDNPAAS